MASTPTNDDPVANPTYLGNISAFFTAGDIGCMSAQGIDLGSYDGVRHHATDIYEQTRAGNMPLGGTPWTTGWVQTFLNWINTGFPMGTVPAPPAAHADASSATTTAPSARLRKNLASLSQPEIDLLKQAFSGIMALDPTDATSPVNPNSYFGLAALHGLPNAYCMHHVDTYNPWHRVYVKAFEDALRSVPGCGDVTLPYWDITTPVPAVVYEAPFANYTLPIDIGDPNDYPAGYVTQRYDAATIQANLLQAPSVPSDIADALPSPIWGSFQGGGFQQYIIEGHDDGHVSCGPTMSDQSVAAYDPIFWFFHCNWDRLWESWQVLAGATTVPGFTATLDGNTDWLPLALDPYGDTSNQTIVWPDISYDALAGDTSEPSKRIAGHALAESAFRVAPTSRVSLRVKDIDRMNIPGTFVVQLMADGAPIARRAFFQPRAPQDCATCRKQSLVSLDFRLDQDLIAGRKLSVAIEVPSLGKDGANFSLAQAGNPTINVRLLLTKD
jgi:tyrosinase